MRKTFFLSVALASSSIIPVGASAAVLLDGGFETQGPAEIGVNPGYCYDNNGGGGPQCTGVGSPWQVANGGGFQVESNSAWPGTASPDGSYYAFIQNAGTLSQSFTSTANGTFAIDFLVAGRNNSSNPGNAAYDVLLNGTSIFSDTTTTGQPFTVRTTNPFQLTSGNNYTLTFQGVSTGPDNTAFIDAVNLSAVDGAVPEPATWAMLLIGFGAIGGAMRRRSKQKFTFSHA